MKKVVFVMFVVLMFVSMGFSEEVFKDGVLTIAVEKDARSLDPIVVADNASFQMYTQIFDSLVSVTKDLEIVPSLAEYQTEDSKVWYFTIRDDVKFHNGDPLTIEDVVYTFETVMDPETSSPNYENLKVIESIEKVDDKTVKFTLQYPFSAFLERVYTQPIVNKALREADPVAYGLNPVGTGPFAIEKWEKNNQLVLVRNEGYWMKYPNLKKVIMKPIPEPSVALVNLEAGDVDLLMKVLPDDFDRISGNSNLTLDVKPALNYYYLAFNVENKPVSNIDVRKAIYMGVDMNAIIDTVLGQAGVRAMSSLSPSSWAYNPDVEKYALAYNPAEAMKLLSEAGLAGGFDITIYTPQDTYRRKIAELMQIQLQAIGVRAKVESLEWASYLPLIDAGKTSMYTMGWNWLTDPDGLIYDIHHSQLEAWETNGSSYNGTRFYSQEVDEALEAARKSSNIAERTQLYQKVQEIWFSNYVHIPLFHKVATAAFNNRVHDFEANAIEYTFLCTPDTNVYVDEK
ncbi:MAG TPA: ABC transporter substrate-binding protein [Thermotogota bacterium]|nr:ABC transporter substrate-binding protein [Thermotogota bacterium]HPJ88777.1 ABC transporter substrate-binding protein [Thermotogota bacterium]HPR96280.1 ABC transporter substrate-binding protein [Thermotogota bacterium]